MFNPAAPSTGVLAGLKASELVESLEEADGLFDRAEYDAAIDAYQSILDRAPALTSLSLQIGHAFREKQEPEQALAGLSDGTRRRSVERGSPRSDRRSQSDCPLAVPQ